MIRSVREMLLMGLETSLHKSAEVNSRALVGIGLESGC